ncbi:3-dehydro-L-gulonate 2-dehydrogenase [Cyclobacterium plantarum]|uniref:3-dehydro-L-gulonate 2-dehydrogenase n=1 Tax=Cyclobacterium plantarum TaxID=2716263 RepID=A0ABX0HHC7_9BACT|nr:3-dehydro-L-gulonate 2-dehydrogenase [Cyclobacterium plantarum]NHE59557.1 3-dehydro-L-gulonate 2-dehydrogenase [Cyclobacterium plantarum]
MKNNIRIPFVQLESTLGAILQKSGFDSEKASVCATLFAKASLDGVASHGLNRFPTFLEQVRKGHVKVEAIPEQEFSLPVMERWDGKLGPGMYNAHFAMGRAISMATENGMGCVALNNTNHWMRAGNYGWQAAEAGCIGICCTNTIPNMPAWGGSEPKLGNNPLVVAVPFRNEALVLDMAMTQYSYGKMSIFEKEKASMPYAAGFDSKGELTKNPIHVLAKQLALPIGLWKGAGLSLMLDLLASGLSNGKTTREIGLQGEEYGISQFFLCFHLEKLGIAPLELDKKLAEVVEDLKATAVFEGMEVSYPGEKSFQRRKENLALGVPVAAEIWEEVLQMNG